MFTMLKKRDKVVLNHNPYDNILSIVDLFFSFFIFGFPSELAK